MSHRIVRMAPIPLSCIRGADIGVAQRSLPPCDAASPETVTAEVDAVDVGRVRITFRKVQTKRHRTVSWFWVAEIADLVGKHVCDRKGPPGSYIDDPDGDHIHTIAPTCSVCGKPQVFCGRAF